jgi:hypothetical protein
MMSMCDHSNETLGTITNSLRSQVTSYEAPHYAVFKYQKKQIFSVLQQ